MHFMRVKYFRKKKKKKKKRFEIVLIASFSYTTELKAIFAIPNAIFANPKKLKTPFRETP